MKVIETATRKAIVVATPAETAIQELDKAENNAQPVQTDLGTHADTTSHITNSDDSHVTDTATTQLEDDHANATDPIHPSPATSTLSSAPNQGGREHSSGLSSRFTDLYAGSRSFAAVCLVFLESHAALIQPTPACRDGLSPSLGALT
jgi:hypothetical protein